MKNFHLLILFFAFSCQPQKLEVQQIISDEPVTIFPHYENSHPDSINMKIPTEYLFNVKPKDVGFPPSIYYSENGILQSELSTYRIFNKKSKKEYFHGFDKNLNINIFIVDRTFHMSKTEAQNILDKYKINKKVDEIEMGDSVNVASYKRVRQDFPWIVERLNKTPDSVAFNFTKNHFLGKKVRIKW